MKILCWVFAFSLLAINLSAQIFLPANDLNPNIITTAIPFLTINPSARAGGMGELGVVSSSLYRETGFSQNPALLSRYDRATGLHNSYIPWLRSLAPGMFILDFGRFYSIDSMNTIAESFSYFNMGNVVLTNVVGEVIGEFNPYEYIYSIKYARTISKNFSVGTGFKYIYSNLTGGLYIEGLGESNPIETWAIDLGFDYRDKFSFNDKSSIRWDVGLAMLNLGPKVSYVPAAKKDFLPAQAKLGFMLTYVQKLGDDIQLGMDVGYQAEKLLVPTPPIYQLDSTGNPMVDQNGNRVIQSGKDPNVSVLDGMLQSFSDAPGGSQEELQEIIHLFGFELRAIIKQKLLIALRMGKFSESQIKGARNYFTFGAGIGLFGFYIDYSLIPAYDNGIRLMQNYTSGPLNNQMKFTLGYRVNLSGNAFKFIED